MSSSIEVFTDVIETFSSALPQFHRVDASHSFTAQLTWDVRTLSNGKATPGQILTGLLYTPDLDASSACVAKSKPYVPSDVTRERNIPEPDNIPFIAIAPWILSDHACAIEYLDAAQRDIVNGMIFFLTDNSTTQPPSVDSLTFNLLPAEDASGVLNEYGFPIFAIPGVNGQKLMSASADYSKNITKVPNGGMIVESFSVDDYVRLAVELDVGLSSALPNLWTLLLVVLGIVLVLMGATSLMMHWVQLRRRRSLRRRVEAGEVDLEALGIKRLTVPKEVLEKMPLYTYGSGVAVLRSTNAITTDATTTTTTTTTPPNPNAETTASSPPPPSSPPPTRPNLQTRTSTPAPTWTIQSPTPLPRPKNAHTPTTLQQPTCPICLDDFIPAAGRTQPGTTVRELPCQHIFHPECVDVFLTTNSSLCPMCKNAALPKGYCPRVITNAMVRRERLIRRGGVSGGGMDEAGRRSRMVSWGYGMTRYNERRVVSGRGAGVRRSEAGMTEMTAMSSSALPNATSTTADGAAAEAAPMNGGGVVETPVQPPSTPGRREWARQRAVAMLGPREAPVDPEAEEARRLPRWRKAVMRVFPGMAR